MAEPTLGVKFRIDVMQPSGPFGSPPPSPPVYFWLDGGLPEFEKALAGRAVFAYPASGYGEGHYVATTRIFTWDDCPDAADIVGRLLRLGDARGR